MSVDHRARGIHVSSGEGIVAHLPNLTAFAKGDESQLNELLVRLNALADAPWHEVVRTLTAGIAESNFDAHPDVACVSIGEDRVAALVFGDTTLSVTTDGTEHTLNGCDSSTWIDVAIHGVVGQVRAGQQSDSIIVGVLRDGVVPAGGFLLDTAGPMPSSGRWIDSNEDKSTAAAAPPPVPSEETVATESAATNGSDETPVAPTESAPSLEDEYDAEARRLKGMFARLDERHREDPLNGLDEFARDDDVPDAQGEKSVEEASHTGEFGGSSEDELPAANEEASVTPAAETPPEIPTAGSPSTTTLAPARPQLRGVLCPDGHLTNGDDLKCRSCGLAVDSDAEMIMGNRPILGQLTFDDGAVLAVDRPAAIGSDVPQGYEIDGEPATVVRLDDGLGGVSPVQVEVRTVGWDVEIHDMNSENGTYTILHGERQTRTRLRAGQSVSLQDGMMVEVGSRNFTYSIGSQG